MNEKRISRTVTRGISKMVFPSQIRLRAGWVAVIIAPLAGLPAIDADTAEWSAEIGR
jgi:hypothetical protein